MADLLFLAQRLPYPPNKGEKIRAFHELKQLSQWFDIHLGCLIDDPADMDHIEMVRPLCRSMHVAAIGRRTGRLRAMRGLLNGSALSVTHFQDRGLAQWVRQTMRSVRPAVTFVYSSNMAPYVLDLPRVGTCVVDLVDVDSEKWRALAAVSSGPMQRVYRREWRKVWQLERRVACEADASILVSTAEADLFSRVAGDDHGLICSVSNGVDTDHFDPRHHFPAPFDSSVPTFVFTGTMDYPPNVDAVAWFVADILPRLPASVRFFIVGGNPTPAVLRLGARAGVVVTGRVPDTRPYLAHATAAVAPMRIARGIQNKVLEAMAMAKATIGTSGALEGIKVTPGTEVLLADNADAFSAACQQMIDRPVADAIGRAARARVVRDYGWETALAPLRDVLSPAQAPRQRQTELA
jgi:polysaccharide biosynthesis protein PslH